MKISIKIFALAVVFLFTSTACNEDFLDVNADPNNPSAASIDLVLPAGIASAGFTLGGQWQILGSFWSQHWTQSVGANQYANIDDYDLDDTNYNRQYIELYAGCLNDLKFVSTNAEATEDWGYYLMAEVMSAYVWQLMVDLYDDVPYFEALNGGGTPNPAFDSGQDIYDDLIIRLDDALDKDFAALTVSSVGSEDLVFGGDLEQWTRFANTLKLKIYMRQTEARPTVAQSGIESLINSGAEFLETDAQMTSFVAVQTFENPYYAVQVSSAGNGRGHVDVAASNTLLEFLQNNADNRQNGIFNTPINGGGHVGLDQGDYSNPAYTNHNDISQPNISATHPVVFIGAAESKFLQAEAAERYGVGGDAQTLYNEGIEASFAKLGVSGAAGLYGSGGAYEYDGSIETIITQKWVSMANFNALESYFESLRTGFPNLMTITPSNVTGGIFPKRLPYPSTELDNNGDAVDEVGGQKQVIQRVWWDPS